MAAPSRHLDLAMARAWPKLAALVQRIALILGMGEGERPERVSRAARIMALRLLRPAEALVRRMVIVMAYELVRSETGLAVLRRRSAWRAPEVRASSQLPQAAMVSEVEPPAAGSQAQAHFHLFEPLPSFRAVFRAPKPAATSGPGPRILDLSRSYPHPPETGTGPDTVPDRSLLRRLGALQRVLAAPERLARRHARFLAHKTISNRPPGRTDPTRPGWPPGACSPHTPAWLRDAIACLSLELRAPPRLPSPGRR